uniref:DUF5801 repeats-in-toxin domain-containing protein n=1 Tax=Kiloniella sp. GXU_MW_B19 TaxID=3141326 RepID=UPI0031D9DEA7
ESLSISGDLEFSPGADGGEITSVAFAGYEDTEDSDPSGSTITSGDKTVVFTQTVVDGDIVLSGTVDGGSTPVLTVTVDQATGAYSVELFKAIDHPDLSLEDDANDRDPLTLNFDYTVTDGDGDTATATLSVVVEDEEADAHDVFAGTLNEADLSDGNTANDQLSGVLDVDANPDGIRVVGLRFEGWEDGEDGRLEGEVLRSGDQNVVFGDVTTNGDGDLVLVGTIDNGATDIITLVVDPDSFEYTITLNGPINHPDRSVDGSNLNDPLDLNFGFLTRDGDGDEDEETLTVTIQDDTPTVVADQGADGIYDIAPGTDFQLDATVHSSFAGYQNSYGYFFVDANGEPISGQIILANVKSALGVDNSLSISGGDIPANAVGLGTFIIPNGNRRNDDLNDGDDVTFRFENGQWVAVDENGTTLVGNGANAFFSIPGLNVDGQDHEIDSSRQGNSNWEDLRNLGDRDFGDVNVTLSVANQGGLLTVDETDLPGNGGAVSASRSFAGFFSVDAGADGEQSHVYELELSSEGVDSGLVDGETGEVIRLYLENGEVVGRLGDENGDEAVRLSVNDSGEVSFELSRTVRHDDPSQDNEAVAIVQNVVSLKLTVTDGDDDTASADVDLGPLLVVRDDAPEFTGFSGAFLGAPEGFGLAIGDSGGIDFGADEANQQVNGGVGADGTPAAGDRAVVFTDSTITDLQGQGLTSNGESLSFALSANGTVLSATAGNPVRTIFTISLSDLQSGSYSFVSTGGLDHLDNDSLDINFAFKIFDADGDSVESNFAVTLFDEGPSVVADLGAVNEGQTLNVAAAAGVLANDTSVDAIAVTGVVAGTGTPVALGSPVETSLGTLTLREDGSYDYVAKADVIDADASDVFTYEVTDADGDKSTATLTINLTAVNDGGQNDVLPFTLNTDIDGGDGFDVLELPDPSSGDVFVAAGNVSYWVDPEASTGNNHFDTDRISNIEVIDMRNSSSGFEDFGVFSPVGSSVGQLNVQDVLDITDEDNTLFVIRGEAQDEVNLYGGEWTNTGETVTGTEGATAGIEFTRYTGQTTDGEEVTLLINTTL